MKVAEEKAFNSLAKYKFVMFGYWAGVWVHLNNVSFGMGNKRQPNPFRHLVTKAREPR